MADTITLTMSNGDAQCWVKDIKREWLEGGMDVGQLLPLLDDAMDKLYEQHPERKRP